MKIRINIVFVKTHHWINMIERYHESLSRIYAIVVAKISEIDFINVIQSTQWFSKFRRFDIHITCVRSLSQNDRNECFFIDDYYSTINRYVQKNKRSSKMNRYTLAEWCIKHSKRLILGFDSWLITKSWRFCVSRRKW
jgi:hypothetical protein